MHRSVWPLALAALLLLTPLSLFAQEEPVDWEMVNKIRDEGLHRSEVMDTLRHLTDEIGPRLTGSPGLKSANEWTRDQLAEWGLENAHLEGFEFGRGWSFSRASVHMAQPRELPLLALPKAWTPGTDGVVRGAAMKVKFESKKDLDAWRGQLHGKILFLDDERELRDGDRQTVQRRTSEDLEEMIAFDIPGDRSGPDWRCGPASAMSCVTPCANSWSRKASSRRSASAPSTAVSSGSARAARASPVRTPASPPW